jgi:hypothetical protein
MIQRLTCLGYPIVNQVGLLLALLQSTENMSYHCCSPGHMSALTGHHYANPTSHLWYCLHLSRTFLILADPRIMSTSITGFTPRLLLPSEDGTLPVRFNLGLVRIIPSLACFFFKFFVLFFSNSCDLPLFYNADQPRRSSINLAS